MSTGLHLLVDGVAKVSPVQDIVTQCISQIVDFIDLKIIHGPTYVSLDRYDETWVIVAESHISVKAFHTGAVLVDVFSCKKFDVLTVYNMIATNLGLYSCTYMVLHRAGTG